MKRILLKELFYVISMSVLSLKLFSQPFIEQTNISLPGVINGSAIWGDYDNDRDLDILLTGSSGTGPISKIFKNNGNNNFIEQTDIFLHGIERGSSAWVDYDNDSKLDIILTGNGKTKVYRNNGNNSFSEQASILLASDYFGSISFGDYNNDGNLDLLLTGFSNGDQSTKIYQNNGNNSFSEQDQIYFKGVAFGSSAWGDYDDDGDLDIIITGVNASNLPLSTLYGNNGDDTFSEQFTISLPGVGQGSTAWGDYDNDGDLDILLTGLSPSFEISKIYKNIGDNTFSEQTDISLQGVFQGDGALGDYDCDGDLDVLIIGSDFNQNNYSILYKNEGNSKFVEQTDILLPPVRRGNASWGDYDNDGDLDIVLTGVDTSGMGICKIFKNNCSAVNRSPDSPKNLVFEIQKTKAILRWNSVTTDETSPKSLTYNVSVRRVYGNSYFLTPHSDLNGYRHIVEMGNAQSDTTYIFKNLRWDTIYTASVQAVDNSFIGGPFSNEVQFKIDPVQASKLTASFISYNSLNLKWDRGNGDRCMVFAREGTSGTANPQDLITYFANSEFGEGSPIGTTGWYCIYKGVGDSVKITGLYPHKNYIIQVIEFQGLNSQEKYLSTIIGNNIGTFSSGLFTEQSGVSLTAVRYCSNAWGDFDNDGFLDLILSGRNNQYEQITKIYHNNGDNTFTEQICSTLIGVDVNSVAWGDYDNDGFLDFILSGKNNQYEQITKIYQNQDNNFFQERADISLPGVGYSSVAWGDYDNDGDLDFVLTGSKNSSFDRISRIYRNDGNNIVTEQSGILLISVYGGSCDWGDYDNDGDLDLLLTGFSSLGPISKVYRNNSDNTFSEETKIVLPGVGYGSANWGDFDNDSDLDILITGKSGSGCISKIFKNENYDFYEQTGISLMGVFWSSTSLGDYDNDGDLDILITGTDRDATYYNPISKIYRNNGNFYFTEEMRISLQRVMGSVDWGDYDNDGDLDLLMSGESASEYISKIWRNNLIMKAGKSNPNSRPNAPSGLKSMVSPGNIMILWSPVTNDETPAKTMTYNIRYKLNTETKWSNSPHSAEDGQRRTPAMGNVQLNNCIKLKNLPSGKYYWQVQAVDQGYQGGMWSEVDSFEVKTTQAFFKADTVCQGLQTHFTDMSKSNGGILSWKWYFGDGNNSYLQNPAHIYLSSGNYNVKLVVQSSGYSDSTIMAVNVIQKPKAGFEADPVCHGMPTIFKNISETNNMDISLWKWNFDDGQSTSEINPDDHYYAKPGSYNAKLSITASNGCIDSISKIIKVGEFPVVMLSSSGPTEFCLGTNVVLSVPKNLNYSYQWNLNDIPITDSISSKITAVYSGKYSVTINNTVANCISSSQAINVIVIEKPVNPLIKNIGDVSTICPGESKIVLEIDEPSSLYNYQWKRNGVPVDNATGATYTGGLKAGIYTVSASVRGCATESNEITLTPKEAFPKPDVYVRGPVVWYMAASNDSARQYKWYRNNELIHGADKFIYVANKTLGTYKVAITNEFGCFTMSDEITIPLSKSEMTNFNIPKEYLVGEDADLLENLRIYPNPTTGMFTIEMDNDIFGELLITIITEQGKDILSIKFEKTTEHFSNQIDLSGQAKGMYFINLLIDNYLATRKVVVE